MSLTWTQESLDAKLVQHLRRDIRAHRRERGRGGHRYVFKDLKELHAGRTEPDLITYVVLTHHQDPAWLVFGWHEGHGWLLLGWHEQCEQARLAAESHVWEPEEDSVASPGEPGIYVCAGWAYAPFRDPEKPVAHTMRVHCRTKNAAIAIAEAFHKLGCETVREEVSA